LAHPGFPGCAAATDVPASPEMSRRAASVATAGVTLFAFATLVLHGASGAPTSFLFAEAVTGMTFVVAGLVAAWYRPTIPAGPILLACGALWYVGGYAPIGRPVLAELGFAFEGYYDLALGFLLLLLTALGGGLRSLSLIAALAAVMAARTVGRLLFLDPPALGPGYPPNPFALFADQPTADGLEVLSNLAMAVLFILVGAVGVRRLMADGVVARRARRPIIAAGVLAMGGAAFRAAEYAWATATGTLLVDLPDPAHEVFQWSLFVLRTLVPIAFVAGVLRTRGEAGVLAPLAASLGTTAGSGDVPTEGSAFRGMSLGDAARRVLGDPSLVLVRARQAGTWVSEAGLPVDPPRTVGDRWTTLIGTPDTPVGAFVHDRALLDHPELLEGVVAVVRLALENERLDAALQAQLDEVVASRARIVAATEEERRRLERDLHDGAQQRLVVAMLALQEARSLAAASEAPPDLAVRLDALAEELTAATRELRELARGIHPAILEHEGLGAAITGLARRASIPVEVRLDIERRLPPVVESTAYFTVAEALTNTQRYAGASHAMVHVADTGHGLEIEVTDDGIGGADPGRGTGLRGLGDRMHALGGELQVRDGHDHGTTVSARIPIA